MRDTILKEQLKTYRKEKIINILIDFINVCHKQEEIINKAIEYTEIQIEDEYEYHGLMYHNDEKDKLLDILKGADKE